MLEKIQETATFLREKMHTSPETAIILGTGLGSLVHEITDKYEISYKDIPNFPVSTVEGHSGKLIFGKLGNKDIMAMQGRFHFYEGYSMKEVTFPVRMKLYLHPQYLHGVVHKPVLAHHRTVLNLQYKSVWTVR
jgi:purine-nucleoside phosphorylase